MDYFTLFGLTQGYVVDTQQLATRYQELQRQFHPDKYASRPQAEQLLAVNQSATINQAWQTLRHPLLRAEYLLLLNGFDLANEQYTVQDTPFLMGQLELREELDDIEQTADLTALDIFADKVSAMVTGRNAQMVLELDGLQWEQAADTVRKLRFFDKLQHNIEQLEEKLSDV